MSKLKDGCMTTRKKVFTILLCWKEPIGEMRPTYNPMNPNESKIDK